MNPSSSTVAFNLVEETVGYQNSVVLRNVTMKIYRGEKVALVGPSGTGKTSLLRTLYGMASCKCAFVHQDFALVPQLSVFHNIYIGRLDYYSTPYNLLNLIRPQKRAVEDITGILRTLGIEEKAFEKVGTLSGGQQQRVSVGRAVYRAGDILLADEPVSSVDPHQADRVMKLIVQSATTMVVSLHAVEFALKFASRIIGIGDGKLQFDLPTQKVTQTILSNLYRSEKTP